MTSLAVRVDRLDAELGALVATHRGRANVARFRRHASDPAGFITEVLRAKLLTAEQRAIAALVRDERQVAVRSCNGAGKDWLAARLALWWVYGRGGYVLITGPTERQVKTVVMGEVRAAFEAAAALPGQLFELALKAPGGRGKSGILAFTSNDVSRLTGFHAGRLLVIVTEAQGLEAFAWEGILANMTGADTRILAVGNPLVASGKFYEAARSPTWRSVHISALTHPNVVEGREVIPGATTREFIATMAAEYGAGSGVYRSRVLGEFPNSDDRGLISRSWCETAAERWESGLLEPLARDARCGAALDPARLGSDASALAIVQGPVLRRLITWAKVDTMVTVDRLIGEVAAFGIRPRETFPTGWGAGWQLTGTRTVEHGKLIVDEVGIGAGVLDRLRQLGFTVHGFNAGRTAARDQRFQNRRAESFWFLRELLEEGRIALPRDARLFDELCAIHWSPSPTGKIQLEPKDETRARLGRSPDRADAVAMAFSGLLGGYGGVPDLRPSHWSA